MFEQCRRFVPHTAYMVNGKWFPKEFLLDHVVEDKFEKVPLRQPDAFADIDECDRRFHIPEHSEGEGLCTT
jgi:hypothetical protein